MPQVDARPWFIAGYLHLAAGVLLGALVAAMPERGRGDVAAAAVLCAGVFLVAGGLLHGFVSPFLKREPPSAWPAHAALAAAVAGTLAMAASWIVPNGFTWGFYAYGAAFLLLPAHVAATTLAGKPWRGGIALFSKDQPFRVGDTLSACAGGLALTGLVVAGLAAFGVERFGPGLALLSFLGIFAEPLLVAVLVFLLPRNAKRAMPGTTLLAFALAVQTFAVVALALLFVQGGAPRSFAFAAAGIALAHVVPLVAFMRLSFEKPGPQVRRAMPLLKTAAAASPLVAAAVLLAFYGGANAYVSLAFAAWMLLAWTLAVAATLLGAPILLNAVPREGRWAALAGGVGLAALFVLGSTYGRDYSAFPAAIGFLVAAGMVLWGLAPMRVPRREC